MASDSISFAGLKLVSRFLDLRSSSLRSIRNSTLTPFIAQIESHPVYRLSPSLPRSNRHASIHPIAFGVSGWVGQKYSKHWPLATDWTGTDRSYKSCAPSGTGGQGLANCLHGIHSGGASAGTRIPRL
jgi:hypothetical protein